ncbi:HAMP domain-containing protein, partial [Bosea sp. (in: a-proteobacteria)]
MRSIRNKILGLIGIVAAGAAIALAFALVALSGIEGMGHRVSRQNDVALATERLNVAVNQLSEDSRLAYMARNPNEAKNAAAAIEKGLNQLNDRLKIFTAIVPANERERATKIGQLVAEFAGIRAETAKLAQEVSGRAADAWGNSEASRRNRAALIEELGGFSQLNEQAGNAVEAESSDYVARMRMLIPLTLLVLLGISVAAAIAFSRRAIVKPLLDLGGVMDRLIAGDTAIEVPHTQRRDEIGAMARSVSVLRETSEQVALLQQQEQAAAAARLARAQSMEAVVSDVGEVVAAAAAGDFSARLQIDQADEQMQKLVAGINEINAVVDSATSEFARTLSAVAAGDLTVRVDAAYRG